MNLKRKALLGAGGLGVGMLGVALFSGVALAEITSSKNKHNLSMTGGANSSNTSEICVFCHTPHNAQVQKPLWNRFASPGEGSFTLYSSGSMKNVAFKSGFTHDSQSKLCISCHDGAVIGGGVANKPKDIGVNALKVQGVGGGSVMNDMITDKKTNFGTDYSKHHPVNFNVALSGDAYKLNQVDLASREFVGNGNRLPLHKSARGDFSLECTSCHDAHDDKNQSFLRVGMTQSALCLTCHKL